MSRSPESNRRSSSRLRRIGLLASGLALVGGGVAYGLSGGPQLPHLTGQTLTSEGDRTLAIETTPGKNIEVLASCLGQCTMTVYGFQGGDHYRTYQPDKGDPAGITFGFNLPSAEVAYLGPDIKVTMTTDVPFEISSQIKPEIVAPTGIIQPGN